LVACASSYTQFYQPITNDSPIATLPVTGNPVVLSGSGNDVADTAGAFTQGLTAIGYVSFNGPNEGIEGALGRVLN
jgi:hypothetical protein